jgi:hypothetical protein
MIVRIPCPIEGEEDFIDVLSLNLFNTYNGFYSYTLKLNNRLIGRGDYFRRHDGCEDDWRMHVHALEFLMEKVRHADFEVAGKLELMLKEYEQDGFPFWEEGFNIYFA